MKCTVTTFYSRFLNSYFGLQTNWFLLPPYVDLLFAILNYMNLFFHVLWVEDCSGSHGAEIRESCGFTIWGSESPSKITSCWQDPFPSHFKLEGPFSCSLLARVTVGPWRLPTVLFSVTSKGCVLVGICFLSNQPVFFCFSPLTS